ncbi:MAG TPA: SRPBCC family protein [Gammaproteobacteria bacterium]|nr:SRPBCC family protein [Gammaproteobacteria bacterium]
MQNRMTLLLAAGLGAMAMYYLDPARGRHRRSLVRDQLVHAGHETRRGVGVVRRDLMHRAFGKTASALSHLRSERPDDRVLVERVRACLGRVVTHPSSVDVEASDGVVTLSGPILQHEVAPLLRCVLTVPGVADVTNRLDVHAEPDRIPGLQGAPRHTPAEAASLRAGWSPTGRALAGVAGGAAAAYGLARGSAGGKLLATAGLALLTRALTNLDARRLLGVGGADYTTAVQKSIRINAPVEQVFELWQDFESFPSFMKHVRRVRRIENGGDGERWRWSVRSRGGIEWEFDSVVTQREENRLLAWTTDDGAFMGHAGTVQFHANADGSTSVEVNMIYSPIGGAVGHAIARLIGADPKHQMDDDLLRLKSFIETGKVPRDAARRVTEIPSSREARGLRHAGVEA